MLAVNGCSDHGLDGRTWYQPVLYVHRRRLLSGKHPYKREWLRQTWAVGPVHFEGCAGPVYLILHWHRCERPCLRWRWPHKWWLVVGTDLLALPLEHHTTYSWYFSLVLAAVHYLSHFSAHLLLAGQTSPDSNLWQIVLNAPVLTMWVLPSQYYCLMTLP